MSKEKIIMWFITITGFLVTVSVAIWQLEKEFGSDPNVQRLLEQFKLSFSDGGSIYSYYVWTVFLTIYIVIGLFEKVHNHEHEKTDKNLKATNYYYTLWVWGFAALIVHHVTLITESTKNIPVICDYKITYTLAFLLGIWGLYLLIQGRIYINGYWANHIYVYPNHKVVKEGIYEKVRHPIYGGQIFLMLSIFLICNNLWLVFLPATTIIYNILRASVEERELDEILKGQYELYKKKCRTSMFLFNPFVVFK
ncbi:isoprenylcysteine carboxylmethyltransferase family protein [uncultured Desulfuromonas sp.]|uniref:methyltransferase family protein n=1 Tax=uncultured Desulfuromonas sp. TaxID=181013 RepID=UPI002AABF041|nr:isoprenylcysteine carboxylmethyltransferase family protein [uncultured Desulfuromonas sp.]